MQHIWQNEEIFSKYVDLINGLIVSVLIKKNIYSQKKKEISITPSLFEAQIIIMNWVCFKQKQKFFTA